MNQKNKYTSALVVLTTLFFMWGLITSLNDILSMAKSYLRGNGCVEEAGAVRSPCEVIEVCGSTCSRAVSLGGRPATESGVDASLVVIGGETIQLAMEVDAVPEEGPVEILAPKGSDKALYKRVRARHEGEDLSSSMSSTRRFARQR